MPELLLALAVVGVGVVIVIALRRRVGSGKPAVPIPTMTGDNSVEMDSVPLERPHPTAATTAATDESLAPTIPLLRTHDALGPQLRDSAEPSTEASTAEAAVGESGADAEPQLSPDIAPESEVTLQSSSGEHSTTDPNTDASEDEAGHRLNNEGSRDDTSPIPLVSAVTIKGPAPATVEPAPLIREPRPQQSVSRNEFEPFPSVGSPEPPAAIPGDETGPATILESGMGGHAIELPDGADADGVTDEGGEADLDEPELNIPDAVAREESEPEPDIPDAVAAEEAKPELDIPDAVTGEEGEPEPDTPDTPGADEDVVEVGGTLRRYRPAPRLPRPDREGAPRTRAAAAGDRSLQMAVRLSFRAGGVCQFSLLAQRRTDLPEQIEVRGQDRTEFLRALQDDWYELKAPDKLSIVLRDGAAWTAARSSEVTAKWALPHRDIYVLGVVADFGGYVSAPRLTIGEDHVVLCVTDRQQDVSAALIAAGCTEVRLVDVDSGVPDGWVVFRNVRPSGWVPATNDGDILDTLRPLANIEILLQGGIKVDRSAWLVGHAPTIRIAGDLASAGEVLIDGQPALIAEDGVCISPNQGEPGDHVVWSSSASRRYQVVHGMQEWTPWAAHPTPNATICGAAVFPLARSQPDARQVIIPAGELSLIGATPGSVLHCSREASSRSPVAVAFPPFDPVWIIPRFPLRCDRLTARVTRASSDLPSPALTTSKPKVRRDALREWSRLILDAHRRKLVLDPADQATVKLWTDYQRVARSMWRRLK